MDRYGFPPPWIALPGLTPDNPATQGAEEACVEIWLADWRQLTKDEKAAYLDHWNASADWRETIEERFERDAAWIEQDAREAAEWAAAHPLPARRRWWQFWR